MQTERRPKTDRNGHAIIAKELHPTPDDLPTQTTQDAVAIRSHGVEELECCDERQDTRDESDDVRVGGEEFREKVS